MKTCIPVAGHSQQAYFYHGNKYAKITVAEDKVTWGPSKVVDHWKTFAKAGFTSIDAAVEIPDHEGELYVFSGTRYVRIKYVPSSGEENIVYGPYDIADQWKSLVHAGFDTVDAILPVPGHKGQAYFFSGNQYAKIKFEAGSRNDEVVYGPAKIVDEWSTLNQIGFDTIDAAIAVPGHEGQAYFFSGSQYVRIEFVPSSTTEKIVYGPNRTYNAWKSLAWGW